MKGDSPVDNQFLLFLKTKYSIFITMERTLFKLTTNGNYIFNDTFLLHIPDLDNFHLIFKF